MADWNRIHLFNPNWPPHAEYHDAQRVFLGSLVRVSELYFLRRRRVKDPERDLTLGALLPSFF